MYNQQLKVDKQTISFIVSKDIDRIEEKICSHLNEEERKKFLAWKEIIHVLQQVPCSSSQEIVTGLKRREQMSLNDMAKSCALFHNFLNQIEREEIAKSFNSFFITYKLSKQPESRIFKRAYDFFKEIAQVSLPMSREHMETQFFDFLIRPLRPEEILDDIKKKELINACILLEVEINSEKTKNDIYQRMVGENKSLAEYKEFNQVIAHIGDLSISSKLDLTAVKLFAAIEKIRNKIEENEKKEVKIDFFAQERAFYLLNSQKGLTTDEKYAYYLLYVNNSKLSEEMKKKIKKRLGIKKRSEVNHLLSKLTPLPSMTEELGIQAVFAFEEARREKRTVTPDFFAEIY